LPDSQRYCSYQGSEVQGSCSCCLDSRVSLIQKLMKKKIPIQTISTVP
jgi:hypothetical protein